MKKALSTAIIATILIASSAWADTDTVTSNNDASEREMHQEHRQKREDQRELRLNMMKEAQ